MSTCTTILNGSTSINITNITSLYNFIGQGISCSGGIPAVAVGWSIILAIYVIITGVALARGNDPEVSSLVGGVVGLVASLFLFGAGMVGSLLVFLMLSVFLISALISLFKGWSSTYQ